MNAAEPGSSCLLVMHLAPQPFLLSALSPRPWFPVNLVACHRSSFASAIRHLVPSRTLFAAVRWFTLFGIMQSQTPLAAHTDASNSLDASEQTLHPEDHKPSPQAIAPYAELSAPGLQPSHSVQAEKEAAHTTEKETIQAPAEKEFVPNTDGDKEVYVYPRDAKELPAGRDKSPQPRQKSRICGLSRSWLLVLAAFVACIIALATALGVVFGRKRSPAGPNPNDTVGGALNPRYYSTQGAFNGSGISLASADFGLSSTILIYYQDYTGDIKVSVLNPDGSLSTGSNTVTSDVRNGTPHLNCRIFS